METIEKDGPGLALSVQVGDSVEMTCACGAQSFVKYCARMGSWVRLKFTAPRSTKINRRHAPKVVMKVHTWGESND